jgi:hypothetical protein
VQPSDSGDVPATTRRAGPSWADALLPALLLLWMTAAVTGLFVLARYDNTPGQAAAVSVMWPGSTPMAHDTARPTLVMVLHPHCTCSRASLAELTEVLARAEMRPRTYVLFVRPPGFAEGWEQTDLWRAAARLADVTLVADEAGTRASSFGAATSGQTYLYDTRGRLVFSGGLTGARAHAGPNAGRTAVLTLLASDTTARPATNVFGCPLFAAARAAGDLE